MNTLESRTSDRGADSPSKDQTLAAKTSDSFAAPRPFSPVPTVDTALDIVLDYGAPGMEVGSASMQGTITLAPNSSPGSRAHSPSPLIWSEPGWSLGNFDFTPFTTRGAGGSASSEAPSIESSQNLAPSHRKSSLGSRDWNDFEPEHEPEPEQEEHLLVNPDKLVRDLCATPSIDAKPVRPSKLVPTAVPFAPKTLTPAAASSDTPVSAATTPSGSRTRPRPFPIDVHIRARQRKESVAPVVEDLFSPTSSPLEPRTPPPFAHVDAAEFDAEGHLVSHGAKYDIADEILQLQTDPLSPSLGQDTRHRSFDSYLGNEACRQREVNQQAVHAVKDSAQWCRDPDADQSVSETDGLGCQAVPFPSLASLATVAAERGRTMSLASSTSLASPFRHSVRSNTVAQLQSYFGPPIADLNVPLGAPAPLDAYAASGAGHSYSSSLASSQGLSRTPSYASLSGGFAAPYPPLAHPEPFNLTPEDPLYLEAREIFVDSSCSSLAASSSSQHCQTMAAHFDRAMHTLNPLASLYGLSQDAAAHLISDPANSGVNEVVLKVAAMRGRQQQMASVQRSAMGMPLPGPSPNNRKLNLYKTELCRSWEEKGSCRYGVKCQFAHGIHELREVARHPKFKSEICRTFWTQGSCPYGKRCCFIHAVPDASSPNASPPKLSAPNTRPSTPSRTHARMTSTAITGAPSRTFGPALSELIGTPRSPSSAQSSPKTHKHRADSNASSHSFGPASLESSALFGLGLRERPGQAPPTYKEAPQSRLQRLANLSAGPSSTSLSSLASAHGTTAACSSGGSGIPHVRHDSAHSFFSSSSVSSAAAYSPLLTRSGSTSSLSSNGGSPVLHRISKDWLTSPTYAGANAAHLDWPAVEELSLEDPPHSAGAMLSHRFPPHA